MKNYLWIFIFVIIVIVILLYPTDKQQTAPQNAPQNALQNDITNQQTCTFFYFVSLDNNNGANNNFAQ
jgi:hypothetical protein